MAVNKQMIRKVHRWLAPVLLLPMVLTLVTGSLYQLALLMGNGGDYFWLIEVHTGKWGPIDLSIIYPFLNAAGLLVMASTGISMWLQIRRTKRPAKQS